MQLENRHDLVKQERGACVSTLEQNCLHSARPECTKHDKVRLQTSTAMGFTRALCLAVRNSFIFCFRFCSDNKRQTWTRYAQNVRPMLKSLE